MTMDVRAERASAVTIKLFIRQQQQQQQQQPDHSQERAEDAIAAPEPGVSHEQLLAALFDQCVAGGMTCAAETGSKASCCAALQALYADQKIADLVRIVYEGVSVASAPSGGPLAMFALEILPVAFWSSLVLQLAESQSIFSPSDRDSASTTGDPAAAAAANVPSSLWDAIFVGIYHQSAVESQTQPLPRRPLPALVRSKWHSDAEWHSFFHTHIGANDLQHLQFLLQEEQERALQPRTMTSVMLLTEDAIAAHVYLQSLALQRPQQHLQQHLQQLDRPDAIKAAAEAATRKPGSVAALPVLHDVPEAFRGLILSVCFQRLVRHLDALPLSRLVMRQLAAVCAAWLLAGQSISVRRTSSGLVVLDGAKHQSPWIVQVLATEADRGSAIGAAWAPPADAAEGLAMALARRVDRPLHAPPRVILQMLEFCERMLYDAELGNACVLILQLVYDLSVRKQWDLIVQRSVDLLYLFLSARMLL